MSLIASDNQDPGQVGTLSRVSISELVGSMAELSGLAPDPVCQPQSNAFSKFCKSVVTPEMVDRDVAFGYRSVEINLPELRRALKQTAAVESFVVKGPAAALAAGPNAEILKSIVTIESGSTVISVGRLARAPLYLMGSRMNSAQAKDIVECVLKGPSGGVDCLEGVNRLHVLVVILRAAYEIAVERATSTTREATISSASFQRAVYNYNAILRFQLAYTILLLEDEAAVQQRLNGLSLTAGSAGEEPIAKRLRREESRFEIAVAGWKAIRDVGPAHGSDAVAAISKAKGPVAWEFKNVPFFKSCPQWRIDEEESTIAELDQRCVVDDESDSDSSSSDDSEDESASARRERLLKVTGEPKGRGRR